MIIWMLAVAAIAADNEQPAVDYGEEAELQFHMGVSAYRAGRFEEALEHLLVSHRLVPNRNVVFNIARVYEQLERYEQAFRHYSEVVRTEPDETKRESAEAAIERITDQVARVSIETTPPGATLYVDRKDLGGRGVTPLTLALPEGEYTLLLELPGWKTAEQKVSVDTGTVTPVELALEPEDSVTSGLPMGEDGTLWTSAAVRAYETVLLRVSPVGCTLMPDTFDGAGGAVGTLSGGPSGSSAAALVPVEGLVVDWTVADGSVWRHRLDRVSDKGLVLADAAPLRPLLEVCTPEGAKVGVLSRALSKLATDERRAAIAFFAEWAAVRSSKIDADMLDACIRGDCKGLAAAVLE